MKPLWRRLQWFLHRDRFEREMEEEIRHHISLKALDQGSVEAAYRQFGNITLVKEDNRRRMWIRTCPSRPTSSCETTITCSPSYSPTTMPDAPTWLSTDRPSWEKASMYPAASSADSKWFPQRAG